MVHDRPEYGENFVVDFRVHFSSVLNPIPADCEFIKMTAYRQENEMDPKQPTKVGTLNLNPNFIPNLNP